MNHSQRLLRYASYLLAGLGAVFLLLTLLQGGQVNYALPLVFLMLGGAFFGLVFTVAPRWEWAVWLFLPGAVLLALGLIFLVNQFTGDWQSWSYAWLLLVAGAGLGMALVGWYNPRLPVPGWLALRPTGAILVVVGLTLFAVFGAIARGAFIQVMAPALLLLGGLALFRLGPRLLTRGPQHHAAISPDPAQPSLAEALPEPLSGRELEVLRLIDQGLTNAEIAARLTLAQSTVKTHINNIYGKLGVQTRVQAVKRARELGLIH